MQTRYSKTRGGFTIVELLVAAGVSLLLMVIITEAFKRGIDMFRTMRAQGVMQERLRTGGSILRDDLAALHFPTLDTGDPDNNPGGSIRPYLSELTRPATWTPPGSGFFRIYQGAMTPSGLHTITPGPLDLPFLIEGTDRDGMLFTRATSHMLHFTVLRKGTTADNMFRTAEPQPGFPPSSQPNWPFGYVKPLDYGENGFFSSQWAEVAYFLVPNGDTANGTPLFNLHRRMMLLVPPGETGVIPFGPVVAPAIPNPEISTRLNMTAPPVVGNYYNRIGNVSQPRNRFGEQPAPTTITDATADVRSAGLPISFLNPPPLFHRYPALQDPPAEGGFGPTDPRAGDDVLLSDVISFEVKVNWDPTAVTLPELPDPAPSPTYNLTGFGLGVVANSDYPFDYLPLSQRNMVAANSGIRVFDTWSRTNNTQYRLPAGPTGLENWQRVDPVAVNATAPRIPLRIRPKAVLIRIRIWDAKAEQARQLTIIQDL